MRREQDMVRDFHETFGLRFKDDGPSEDGDYPDDLLDLRQKLIDEEFGETYQELYNYEFNNDSLARLTKELCDLLYVIYGTGVSLGIDLHDAFEEVHESNMSKANADGSVNYRADGKVLKSERYQAPNMQAVLELQRLKSRIKEADLIQNSALSRDR